MRLFASLVTTMVIVAAVWGAVFLQPVAAESSSKAQLLKAQLSKAQVTKSEEKTPATLQAQKKSKTYIRSVVTKTIPLDTVTALWVEFEDKITKQEGLPKTLDRLIVIYQNIDKNFGHATVTIGFPVEANTHKDGYVELTSSENRQQLLNRGKHSNSELANAWEDINFRKSVKAVIETHYLNALGQEESNQIVVHYN